MRKWLNILVIAIPLTIAAWVANGSGTYAGRLTEAIFILALVAVIPLASLLGGLTESLEVYFGDRLGGLLGASFANVPELAIGIGLLVHAQIHKSDALIVTSDMQVIRGLLIGSVINNILFVLVSPMLSGKLSRTSTGVTNSATWTLDPAATDIAASIRLCQALTIAPDCSPRLHTMGRRIRPTERGVSTGDV